MKHELTALRLKEALNQCNMIPKELSVKSGVSESSISQYVNGSHAPSNISSGKMASVLGVDPMWLMGFDVPMHKNTTISSTRTFTLNDDEKSLIISFRSSDEQTQEMVRRLLAYKDAFDKYIHPTSQ